jgi:hypothetical protein
MNLRLWFSSSIAVGITMFLVGGMFHILIRFLAPDILQQYKNPALFRDWDGWTSTYMLIHPFIYAPVFTSIFLGLRRADNFPSGIRGGLINGAGVFCVGSLPVFLMAFASFQVSAEIILTWIFQNLCQYLAAGIAIGAVTDGVTVRLGTQLSASAVDAWERLLQKETFLQIIRGWLTVRNSDTWPATLFRPATAFVMQIRPLGIAPVSTHTVNVIRVDQVAREIETEENGQFVTTWNHLMRVETAPGNQSRYTDCIHLNAGLLTPFVWLFAIMFYRSRQQRLSSLFASLNRGNADE